MKPTVAVKRTVITIHRRGDLWSSAVANGLTETKRVAEDVDPYDEFVYLTVAVE